MGMSPLVQQLAQKLDQWEPEVSQRVESLLAEIMDLANAPLFRGEYTAVEKDTWREGMPLFGTKATSQRSMKSLPSCSARGRTRRSRLSMA